MRIINCEQRYDYVNEEIESLPKMRIGKFIIIEENEPEMDISTELALTTLDACIKLQRLNKTLARLKIDNNIDQQILFEVLQSIVEGTKLTELQKERYFVFIDLMDEHYEMFYYLNGFGKDDMTEFRPDIDIELFVLDKMEWSNTGKQDEYMDLRYEYTDGEMNFKTLVERVNLL